MVEATVVQPNSLDIVMGADLKKIQSQLEAISNFQQVVQSTLSKDQDYGIIPGTKKPTLLKPGAEKIIMLMGLTSTYDIVEKVEDYEEGFFAYTVQSSLIKGGQLITQGFGSANTRETRYKLKDNKGWQDPYTLVNTVLKMAKKRAQVDASLTVGSLSNIFTQDMEDLRDVTNGQSASPDDPIVNFGKHKGKTVSEIYSEDKGYVKWLSEEAKDEDVKKVASDMLKSSHQQKEASEEKKANKRSTKRITDEQVKEIEALSRQLLEETGEDIIRDWNATDYRNFSQSKAEQLIGLAMLRLEEHREQVMSTSGTGTTSTDNPFPF